MLDVSVVMAGLERAHVQLFQPLSGRRLPLSPELEDRIGQDPTHRRCGTREVRVGEVDPDSSRRAADRHPVVHEPRQFLQAAAPDDLGAVGGRFTAVDEPLDRRQAFEPLHQRVVAAAIGGQVVQRKHETDRDAGAVRVDEAGHVEPDGPPVDDAVPQ